MGTSPPQNYVLGSEEITPAQDSINRLYYKLVLQEP